MQREDRGFDPRHEHIYFFTFLKLILTLFNKDYLYKKKFFFYIFLLKIIYININFIKLYILYFYKKDIKK